MSTIAEFNKINDALRQDIDRFREKYLDDEDKQLFSITDKEVPTPSPIEDRIALRDNFETRL